MDEDAAPESTISRLRRRLTGPGIGAVLVRGASGTAGVHIGGAVVALLAQLVLARLLGVSQYGYYVYAFTWIVILVHVCRLGFHNSLIRFTAAYRTDGDWPGLRGLAIRSAQLVGLASVVTGALVALVSVLLNHRIPADQLRTFVLAAITLVPLALLGVTQGLLQGYRRPVLALLPFRTFVHGGTLLLGLVVLGGLGLRSAPAAMAVTLLATTVSLAVAATWVSRTLRPDIAGVRARFRTRSWLAVSLPMMLIAGTQILLKQTDTVMLGAMTGTDAAGLYFPVARISELAALGLLSANAILAPMISELHTRGEPERLQRMVTLAAIGISGITLVATFVFVLFGEWALGLFGEAFRVAYPALLVLLAGQVVRALCGPVEFLMTMTGHERRAALVHATGAGLNVVLNVILIPQFGIMGAAVATATSTAFWSIWLFVEIVRREGVNPSVFTRWPPLQPPA